MKSHTKPALRVMPAAQVQISLPVAGRFARRAPRRPGPVHRRRPEVLGGNVEADRHRAVRDQGSARRCNGGPCVVAAPASQSRTGRPAHCGAPNREPARRSNKANCRCQAFPGPPFATRWTWPRSPRWPRAFDRRYASTRDDCRRPTARCGVQECGVAALVALTQEQLDEWLSRPLDNLICRW